MKNIRRIKKANRELNNRKRLLSRQYQKTSPETSATHTTNKRKVAKFRSREAKGNCNQYFIIFV